MDERVKNFSMGGAAAAVLLGLWGVFEPDSYSRIPPGFEAAIAVLLGGILAYFKPRTPEKQPT